MFPYRFRVFENRVLRRIFEPKREEVANFNRSILADNASGLHESLSYTLCHISSRYLLNKRPIHEI
jgi:hypothetical protein